MKVVVHSLRHVLSAPRHVLRGSAGFLAASAVCWAGGLVGCSSEEGGEDLEATGGSMTVPSTGGSPPGTGGMGGESNDSDAAGGRDPTGSGGSDSEGSGGTADPGLSPDVDPDYCAPTADWDAQAADFEEEVLRLVNEHRAAGANCGGESFPPTHPLEMDPALQCAARVHTLDMAERDYFDHESPEGTGPGERIEEAGFSGFGWGENIAGGSRTPEGAVDQWMNSAGHCSNIMRDSFYFIGVGFVDGRMPLWTQTFGSGRR